MDVLNGLNRTAFRAWGQLLRGAGALLVGAALLPGSLEAAIQFDVFLGYGGQPTGLDGVVREVGWFALGCEVLNDGPSFNGTVEVSNAEMGQGQTRRFVLELPTNTRKRFVIPVFSSTRGGLWGARLLDERGRERAKQERLVPRALAWESLLFGAVPRTFAGAPKLPDLVGGNARAEMQPLVARVPVELLPDNPIAYEGMDALYLNSEKALELKEPQAEALVAWVRGGGHLLLAVEQPADVNATPWLRTLLPCAVGGATVVRSSVELHQWVRGPTADAPSAGSFETLVQAGVPTRRPPKYRPDRSAEEAGMPELDLVVAGLAADPEFEGVEFPAVTARLQGARVELALGGTPLVVSATRERGRVTVLLFSPEREPFRSWKHREWFWARLLRVPSLWFSKESFVMWGGNSLDGVIGAMIDSRQVRKLPVQWLLLLLLVYLVVIGPFDQWLLRRLNRQMLTWVTFPGYVVLFSLLIYYIGYRLRAGETEWNELHLVDIVPHGQQADLRGRTYGSIYSPVNDRYRLASDLPHATLRSEFIRSYGSGREGARVEVQHRDRGFEAEVFVPVWTSQLLVSDWWEQEAAPVEAVISLTGGRRELTVRNRLSVAVEDVRLVLEDRVLLVGRVDPGKERTIVVALEQATPLDAALTGTEMNSFGQRVQARYQAFGSAERYQLGLNPGNLMGVSFLSASDRAVQGDYNRWFVHPAGIELSGFRDRGDAVLLAWVPGYSAMPTVRRFPATRVSQNTLYRLVLPAGAGGQVGSPPGGAGPAGRR